MKKRIFLFLLLLSGFSQVSCSTQVKQVVPDASQQQAQGADIFDFGTVKEGGILKHEFVLKNSSSKTLTISDVSTSCGCTVSKVKDKVVPGGSSTIIEAVFNSQGESGAVEQHIYVYTDSLDSPMIRFIIKANVVKS